MKKDSGGPESFIWLLLGSRKSLFQRIGELIGARGGLEAATGTADPVDDVFGLHADDELGDAVQVAGAATLEGAALDDAVGIDIDGDLS